MKDWQLPDYCFSGRPLEAVDGVVLHYFSARNVDPDRAYDPEKCWQLFCDLNRPRHEREWYMTDGDKWPENRMYASAHALIDTFGEVHQLQDWEHEAYHAGASVLNGRAYCNRWTLGIELIGGNQTGFGAQQYRGLARLLADLEERFGFSRENVAGHDQVRWTAILAQGAGNKHKPKYDPSGRKDGTGGNFDWWHLGKLWNDIRPHPDGTIGLERYDEVMQASQDCNSHTPEQDQ